MMDTDTLSEKLLVLVVDDVKDNILILREILHQNYRLIFATNGQSALRLAKEQQPDIILLDVMMPDMDGYEVCTRLKADENTAKIPVIFVTAKDSEDDELRALEFGAVDYITKPLRPDIVKLRVGVHLDLHRQKQKEKQLIEDKLKAEAFSKAKSEFLSRMSHELRTPMNAVLGFAQLLEMEELNEDQRDNVTEIICAGKHLMELINDILELSKIESGKLELDIKPFDFSTSVTECITLTRLAANKRNISIDNRIDDGQDIRLVADMLKFKQVLLNLMSNAVKYNQENGRIIISHEPLDDNHLSISVTDSGKGLSPEQLERIFNSFERLGVPCAEIEGSGIGLCISKQLVEAMGGELEVASQPGEGSRFSIVLPCLALEHATTI